ncbi:uncharacterized protein [Triticum aestivum]|nr:uncharacterized protein LOC123078340 isoform X3 [Triticum aestivum]
MAGTAASRRQLGTVAPGLYTPLPATGGCRCVFTCSRSMFNENVNEPLAIASSSSHNNIWMIRWVFFYMVTINAKGLHFYLNHYIWLLRLLDCTVQNYANRTKCFRCNAPKSYYG